MTGTATIAEEGLEFAVPGVLSSAFSRRGRGRGNGVGLGVGVKGTKTATVSPLGSEVTGAVCSRVMNLINPMQLVQTVLALSRAFLE